MYDNIHKLVYRLATPKVLLTHKNQQLTALSVFLWRRLLLLQEFHRLVGFLWQHANEFNQLVVNAVGKLGCNNPLELGLQMWDMFLLIAESSLGRSFDSPLLRTLEGQHNHMEELQEELGRAVKVPPPPPCAFQGRRQATAS